MSVPPGLLLDYQFTRPDLLREALTHRSASEHAAVRGRARLRRSRAGAEGEGPASASRMMDTVTGSRASAGSNERLEFLGDRVLGLLIAEWLAERFPDEQEGELGRRHAQLVSGPVVARAAASVGLPAALSIAPGEARAGVAGLATVRADAMEALIGALYLDGGLDVARRFVRRAWQDAIETQHVPPKDPKTALQEWALGRGLKLPHYALTGRSGPSHEPVFTVSVTVAGQTGTGSAGSKRLAERTAAADLLGRLG